MKTMKTLDETKQLIQEGYRLLISGSEELLKLLPLGNWIGGTSPYFMTSQGGIKTELKLHVTILPNEIIDANILFYTKENMKFLSRDYKANGLSFIVIPAYCEAHEIFARECSTWPGIFETPLVGWISGTDLDSALAPRPKVINGLTGEISDRKCIVMHTQINSDLYAKINLINLFKQGTGDLVTFKETSFVVHDCWINGQKINLYDYLTEHKISSHFPLVASYNGTQVNVAIKNIDKQSKTVSFFAPVFNDIDYRFAFAVNDYEAEFKKLLLTHNKHKIFSCNCILNYIYANLELKNHCGFSGPVTFGEIAYMLLNQTLVYVTLEPKKIRS